MEEQDLFPEISGFQIPKEAESVLRSQNVNLTQYQKEINNDILAGGDRKNRRIQHTFQLLDKVLGTTYYSERLSASLPATQKEVVESFGNTTGKQNFLGNFWNNSAPALVEGVGKLGAILPAIFETDDQDWNKRNKAVEDFVRPMLTYVDDSFANSTPISWDKEKGEVDFSNLTSGAAWASTVSSLLGFMAPVFATAGVGGIVRGVSGAGKAAEGLTALAEVADVAANGAKLDKIGKAMMGIEFASSTAMMFPEYQKMGIDSGLTIGQATKVALPLAIVNGAIELIGGEAFAKGLGFTTTDASKVIREVTLQNTDNVLAGLRSGAKLDEAMFQDIVERVAKDTVNTLSDPSQRPLWKTIVNRVGRAAKDQGIPESFEEGLQSTSEELAKAIYNSTVDPSVPEGKGRFANFSPQEYATNSLFGTFLGGMMGTGMGMLHKNPKVFDQTLFNYVGADVASQIANGAQSFEEIAPNLKAYRLAQKGLEEGHWDEAEAAKIEQKIGNMAQVAFEFAQSKEIGKTERYAMYQLTQTQNGLLDQESEVVGLRQSLAEAQKAIDSGTLSPKALIDANRLVNETGQKLGDYDAQNDVFAIESEIATKKAVTSNLMKEVGKAMADVNLQKIAPRYLMNELSKVNGETMSDVNYVSEQGLLIIRQADGKSSRLLGGEIRPVPNAALSDDLAFTQDSYQPKERAQIVPKPYFESFAEYQEAERIYSAGKKIGDIASLTTSPVADASEVIALGQQMVQSWKQMLMPESETPIVETLMPLYDYYKQIEDYDAEGKYGVAKYETPEAFFAKLGVPTESDALDAAEDIPVETSATTQPESLASLPEVELQVQTEQTNEGYDESLVEAQIQAFVEANGITPEVSIPIWVDVAIRRAEMALPMSIDAINEAADYLYKLYGQWKNMKKASSRMYTIAQIDEMLEAIGADIELLIQYRNAYEEGTESEFRGRDQAAEASSNPETALSNAQSQTPVAEPANPNSPIEDGNTQIDKQTNQDARQSASDIQSEFAQEQQRTEAILNAGTNLEDAASLTAQLETLTANDNARVEQQLEASIRALEAVSDSLDQVDPDIATQSGNQDSGTNGNTEAQIDQLTSRQVRKKLEELRRVPQSFREAVLWYFADGGKVRREDIVRFLGEGAISGGKGSNAYLSYIADTAQPYDSVLRTITESMGYQSVEELGDETSLTDAMFEEIASFYGTSPNRLLLGVLLAEQAQEYEPLFGEVLPADELVAHFSVDESTLEELLPEDIETFEAFLRTLPNNIDPTNPEQVFAAFLEYSKDGFPPMSESAMRLIDAVAAAGIDANPALPKEYKDLFQPLIEKYNESVRQNDPVTETASPNGSVESSGASASPPVETRSRPEKPKSERRTKLDNKAKKLREALAADWDAFLSPGDSASSSVIGITPQQFAAASRMIVNLAELGINRFEDAMLEIIDIVGLDKAENGFKAFKAAYFSVKANDDNTDEDLNALRKVTFENIKDLYVSSTSLPLESDSPRGGIGQPMGPENVQPSSAGVLGGAGNGGDIVGESGDTFTSDSSIPLGTTVAIGNEGDPDLHSSQRNDVTASSTPGLGDNSRGSGYDENRLSTEREGVSAPVQSTSEGDGKAAKQRQQLAAEPIPVVNSNLDNIVETLPYLLPHQQTNVLKAETRLLEQDEKGILFTDGTGTGKTLTALGIAKRFLKRGAKNILIVTPSDKKIKDWIDEASILGIQASGLKGLDDKGEGVSVTTYANFGQNKEISKRTFDLIIYDESHNIMSNEQGNSTLAFDKHLQLSKPAYTAYQTAYDEYREALNQAGSKASKAQEARNEAERLKWRAVYEEIKEKKIPDRTKELIAQTKVVFLSATPFPYHKSIQYADGFLFKAGQNLDSKYRPIEKSGGYNSGNEFEKYMMSAFGYRMRYNRLTTPESGVDVGLMERNWIEKLKQSGAVSGTKLEIPQDYSREFVLLSEEKEALAIGSMIDEGLKIIHDNQEYRELSTVVHSKMDYLYKNRLLEQIKAKLGIGRIRKHIEAGRKVVVFHSYNEGVASHPFDFSFLGEPAFREKFESITAKAAQQAADFTRKYPEYAKLDLSGLRSVPTAISKAFGGSAVMFNGNIPNKKRLDNVKAFNDNGSEVSIIVVNIAAGEAGLNLHDTTGQHQRVVVQLGLPVRPTSAIQSEGRIYRTGQKTNAIFEYFVTHLNFEKYAFGSKINERSGTAENLAMGNEARDLKVSFKEGYLNPVSEDPSENQGTGGKQMDYSRAAMTPFQKAITYYYARAKKTSKNKSAEGVDYFATPEPLGMKMVEWLYAQPNDKLLEPSAGHGAIARFFPDNTDNVMIEPSTELRSDLAVSAHGTAVGATFEQLSIVNKFDGIAMNPPFGTGAKTAMEHLQKAIKHLNDKGRIVALVPVGQMDKRLEKYLYGLNEKGKLENPEAEFVYLTSRILLPSATFERAGTNVATQILIFDKEVSEAERVKLPATRNVDLRSVAGITDLFDAIENLEMPARNRNGSNQAPVVVAAQPSRANNQIDSVNMPVKGFHAKNQKDIFVVQTSGKLSDQEYTRIKSISSKHNGYYSSFRGNGATPGFQFQTLQDANAFYKEVTGKEAPQAQMMFAGQNIADTDIQQSLLLAQESYAANGLDKKTFDEIRSNMDDFVNWERVRIATGWFKGVDNQWQYEFSDADAQLLVSLEEIQAEVADEGAVAYKLIDILKHNKLYNYYPQTEDIEVFFIDENSRTLGQFDPITKELTINLNQYNERESSPLYNVRSVILHELQHYIQSNEGLEYGSSSVDAEKWLQSEAGRNSGYYSEYARIEQDISRLRLLGSIDANGNPLTDDAKRTLQSKERIVDKVYRANAGEVAARNTQARANMSELERRASAPIFSTLRGEGVPASQVWTNNVQNTINLLGQRFGGVRFETPATEAAYMQIQQGVSSASEAAYGFWDPVQRRVVLNPNGPGVNTAIHEIAHPWVSWAKQSNPEMYQRGIDLVRDSFYTRELLRDPNYQGLSIGEIYEEALVRAIADQGEKFITPIRKKGFLEWFRELFDSIAQFLGIRNATPEQLATMSLEEFAKAAAADILAGDTEIFKDTTTGNLSDEAVSKTLFSFARNSYDFSQNQPANVANYASWQDHVDYAFSMIPIDILTKRPAEITSKDRKVLDVIFAQTGLRYKGAGDWDFDMSKSPDTAFLGNGSLVRMDRFGQASNQKGLIATTYRNGFLKLYNQEGIKGDIFRFVVNNLRGLFNIETMASLLDDGSGIITSLINDVKRVGGRNKAYVTNILNPKRWKIAQLAKDFTIYEGVNTIWTAKRVEVETYGWDENAQDVVTRRVEVPLATAMSLVLTADTQDSMGERYGGNSVTIPDRFVDTNGNLIDIAQYNPNATPAEIAAMKKAIIFSQAKNVHRGAKLRHSVLEKKGDNYEEVKNISLLLSNKELEKLRNRFANGNGITSDAETEVFSLLKDAFNDKVVRDMIKNEDEEYLNFGEDFVVVTDYFPINSADGQAQVDDRLKYRPALEDAKLLNERAAAPKSVWVGDALDMLEDYEYRVGNILEHGRLSHNITTIANALRTEIPDDPLVSQMTQWLLDRRELIEDWRGYKAARQDKHKWAKPINLILSRYTSSIFRLNFGMATKQLATYYSAAGQSMLKDEYLFKAEGYKNLLSLSRGMVTDTISGVGAEVVEGTDVGFVDALGGKSTQADIIRELLGENIEDPAEKQTHRRRYATVIERVLYAQNAYVGGVDFDKVTFNQKGLGLMQKLFGRADSWMENIGMAPMRISDRAVILSYYLAAKEQVSDEIAAGTTENANFDERVAEILESALYATNQMNKVADMTTMQTSTNWLTKLLGLYSGQTQKLLNVFVQAFVNSLHNPDSEEAKTRLRKAFISNAIVVPLYLASVTTIWSVLKAIANGDEPKDYSYYQEQYFWNVVKNMGSIVPGLSEQVATTIISKIDNEPWSDSLLDYPGDEIVNSTIESFIDLYNWGAAEDQLEAGKYADSFYYNIEKSFSGWTGTPKVVTRFVREHTTTDQDDQ